MSDNRIYSGLLDSAVAALESVGRDIERYTDGRDPLHLTSALTLMDLVMARFNRLQEACDDALEVGSVRHRTSLVSDAVNRSMERIEQMHDLATQAWAGSASDMHLMRIMALYSTTLSVLSEAQWLLSSDLIEMYFLPNAG